MYDCPHKQELEKAVDEITELSKKNEELNQRLESVDNLIEQGLIDIKGIISGIFKDSTKVKPEDVSKIVDKIEAVFDTQKITDIVNDNLKLRKESHIRELKVKELKQELSITAQEKESLEYTLKLREDKDINLIKDLRNMDKQADEQLSKISQNNLSIKHQESELKALNDFISKARESIKDLKEEHTYLQKEVKAHKAKNLTGEAKKVLSLVKKVKSLRNGSKWGFNAILKRNTSFKAKVVYMELKDAYFGLADYEKQKIVNEYDEVAKLMGE